MKNLPLSLALAASSGIFTLQRPADWSPRMRRTYVVAPGVALGAIGVLAVRKGAQKGRELAAAGTVDLVTPFTAGAGTGTGTDGGGEGTDSTTAPSYVAGNASGHRTRVPAIALAVLAATVGTTVSGLLALGLVLDERMETWLVRRGVAQPRRVMAVAAAAGSLILDQAMDSRDSSRGSGEPGAHR
ncbi:MULTISPECIES: hypothetical protein [unclassified Arthrobacter]|uniref:hypothetical protein n=1 Tax=unclassified Arthrobacter TaxID=235627 RepID=UPI001E39BE07|nr:MULTISPECIES: hypothetical protein [unclassified Arthrobacter]MCC9144604.1 hypothetical protein [Arthrobacter sp. zg-Y919]MDK1275830.1 hypothetical protein [Arthrobacter sp. zg.Y919]WIB02807.1 hypothetical protein QNO10_12820 [Arthrobacter sp. zg-Y919]